MPDAERRLEAIEAAKAVFWRKGFTETSMADVVDATGMNRYALYSTFGNKREIFLAALERYFEEGRALFEPILSDSSIPPLVRIAGALRASAKMMVQQDNGCFMCHVAVNDCAEDAKVAAAVRGYFVEIQSITRGPLEEAAASGQLNPNLTPAMAGQLVFDAKMSMGVHARAGADMAVYETIVEATLAALTAA